MGTATMNRAGTVLAAGLTAISIAIACGGSHQEADTPTNEGAVPSDVNSTRAPSNDMGAGGMPGSGTGVGGDATTPPDGYAGSPGPGSSNKSERKPRDGSPTVASEPG
ncbi:MAG TPA: hypothetical protein VHU80_14205 [Polyangiaceae bacterium]|jgi:hypothetical protein|nr:hypothetical protein [Polyangiaceae bacterium]